MIRRAARPTQDFTIIRNDVLRDSRLSYRARGLLASILSRPDNWTIRSEQLAREGGEGRDAIRTALNELKDHGYLESVQYQDPVTGRFSTEQVVYDRPLVRDPEPENPSPGPENPASDNQASVFQALLEEQKRTTEKEELNIFITEQHFDEFWASYPRKVGKGQARTAFLKALKKAHVEDILAGCKQYAEQRAGQDPAYTAHPATWLNGERWTDEPDPQFQPQTTTRDKQTAKVQQALERIRTTQREITA